MKSQTKLTEAQATLLNRLNEAGELNQSEVYSSPALALVRKGLANQGRRRPEGSDCPHYYEHIYTITEEGKSHSAIKNPMLAKIRVKMNEAYLNEGTNIWSAVAIFGSSRFFVCVASEDGSKPALAEFQEAAWLEIKP